MPLQIAAITPRHDTLNMKMQSNAPLQFSNKHIQFTDRRNGSWFIMNRRYQADCGIG